MKYAIKSGLILAILLFALQLSAQSLRKANRAFNKLNYAKAIELYESYLKKNNSKPEALKNLAEAYRKTGDFYNAERIFEKVVTLADALPIHSLYYGQALQINGKCNEALPWLEAYTEASPSDKRGQSYAEACKPEVKNQLIANGAFYTVTHPANINSEKDDFSPAYYKDGIVFSSEHSVYSSAKVEHSWTGLPFVDLYFSKATLIDFVKFEYQMGDPVKLVKKSRSRLHDGPAVFSRDEKKVYFTRNNLRKGKAIKSDDKTVNLKIFEADLDKDGNWKNIKALGFNSDEFNACHPALSADGYKMIFSSDMPSGYGGMDLYVSYYNNGMWSPPTNLGPEINTEGNELFPFLHQDGTLYFSSDGHVGLGGLDIYSTMQGGSEITMPVNIGYPINGYTDDFGLILNDERVAGYFTSDRPGGKGRDDIYSFTKAVAPIEVLVYDKESGNPIEGATVSVYCRDLQLTTDSNGKALTEVATGQSCEFVAMKEGYFTDPDNEIYRLSNPKQGQAALVKIPLVLDKKMQMTGVVKDEFSGKPLANAIVILENTCGDLAQTVRTGEDGSYSFKVKDNCCYYVSGSFSYYLNNTIDNVCPENTVTSQDIALINLGSAGMMGSILLEHIYYDYDKSFIREDASTDLQKLLNILSDNPRIIVEIGSHTDSRGPSGYNRGLSLRRAKAVASWLQEKGVEKKRLLFRGYGETQTLNGCSDNVQCTEEEHQRNRRTEFTVVGTLDGKPISQESVPPVDIKTDPCKGCKF